MKRFHIALAMLLAVVMLLGIAPLTAFAENGPMTTPVDYGSGATYLAWITGYEPDAQGNYYNDYGMLAGQEYTFYKDLQVYNNVYPGISYDIASNTLTLNNADAPKLAINTNVMGDDFTINVIGTNALANIRIWGDGYGGNLTITGSGTLTVNENKDFGNAIDVRAEGTPGKVTFGKDVKLHLYGDYGVAQSTDSTAKNAADVFVCENGQKLEEVTSETVYYTETREINGIYAYNPEANTNAGWRAISKSDPTGIYAVTQGYREDPSNELVWVSKYVYMPEYDSYIQDYNAFKGNAREHYGELEYTAAEWEAQSEFTVVTVPSEDPAWVQFRKEEDKDEEGNWTWSEQQLRCASDPDGIYAYSTGTINDVPYVEIHRFYYDSGRKVYIRDNTFSIQLSPDELEQNGWTKLKGVDKVSLEFKGNFSTAWGSVCLDAKGNEYIYKWGDGVYSFKEGSGVQLSDGFYYYLTKEGSVEYESLTRYEKVVPNPDVRHFYFNAQEFHYNTGSVAPHEHSYAKKVVKPTTTTLGYTLYSCSCGDSYKKDFTAPTGKVTGFKCALATKNSLKAQWSKNAAASGYKVQLSKDGGKTWATTATIKGNKTVSYTFKKLAAAKNYKLRVCFFITAEDGKDYCGPWSKAIAAQTLLATGTNLTKVTAGNKSFTAQWKLNKSADGYQVQYSTNAKFSGAKSVTVKKYTTLKTTVKKLSAKKVYYVRVRTFETIAKVNYYSAWSKSMKVKTK